MRHSTANGRGAIPQASIAAMLRTRSALILCLVTTLFLGLSFGREAIAIHQIQQNLENLEAQVALLEDRRDTLQDSLEQVQRLEHLEKLAREGMAMKRPGDQIWIVYGDDTEPRGQSRPVPAAYHSPTDSSYWSEWYDALFHQPLPFQTRGSVRSTR